MYILASLFFRETLRIQSCLTLVFCPILLFPKVPLARRESIRQNRTEQNRSALLCSDQIRSDQIRWWARKLFFPHCFCLGRRRRRMELRVMDDFKRIATSDGLLSIAGFGSLLSGRYHTNTLISSISQYHTTLLCRETWLFPLAA